jgi:hypothetical protein
LTPTFLSRRGYDIIKRLEISLKIVWGNKKRSDWTGGEGHEEPKKTDCDDSERRSDLFTRECGVGR